MSLNCKVGDLAIIVHSTAGNEGKIVRVVKPLGRYTVVQPWGNEGTAFWWYVEPALMDWSGAIGNDAADDQLRPIRDPGDDAQDESARYLPPVPQVSAPMVTKEAAA